MWVVSVKASNYIDVVKNWDLGHESKEIVRRHKINGVGKNNEVLNCAWNTSMHLMYFMLLKKLGNDDQSSSNEHFKSPDYGVINIFIC